MVTNIAINNSNPTNWFQGKGTDKIAPSEAEKIIIRALNGHEIEYYTEVSFEGMRYSTGSYARYDFWIPSMNLLIEYDGVEAHSTEEQLHRDRLKNHFCKRNNIKLIRFNKYVYYNLGQEVAKLILKEERIKSIGKEVIPKSNKPHKKSSNKGYKKKQKTKVQGSVQPIRPKGQSEIKEVLRRRHSTNVIKSNKKVKSHNKSQNSNNNAKDNQRSASDHRSSKTSKNYN